MKANYATIQQYNTRKMFDIGEPIYIKEPPPD
jgi:hypothetical protein